MSIHLHIGQCGNQLGAAYWLLAPASSDLHEEDRRQYDPVVNKHSYRASGVPAAAINGSSKRAPLSRHLFHPSNGAARCILVDSEPKVIQSVCEGGTNSTTGFQPACTHVEQAGRGNNWAMGYYGPRRKAPQSAFTSLGVDDRRELVELVMDSVQREIEGVDCYQGSVVMHSLGGGTGSGLGCRVLENLRDTYSKAYIVTASVAPSYTRGDTPLQNYNAVLTLRCLQEVADAVIYKDNDDLLRTAGYWKALVQERAGIDSAYQRVSLDEINSMVAADLAGLLFPVETGEVDIARPFDFGQLLHDVCPMPAVKMLDVRSGVWRGRAGSGKRSKLPLKTSVAKGVSSAALFHAPVVDESRSLSLRHGQAAGVDASLEKLEKLVQQACGSFPRTYNAVMASSTIVRGFIPATCDRDRFSEKLSGVVHTAFPPVSWLSAMPQAALTYSRSEPFPAFQGKASATICVNNGSFLESTKRYLERAQRQFHVNAYVHWYKQHGMEDGDFETAFAECATLISEYEALLR
ncbi:Tubulin delta chain [Phytophthora citrophthora]|uniref:Tubulin delta chain n=1 Tax=Phytophthora citrophthora TaxID=4793 RepID=A0AAD9LPJ1_9STRA|nr:Tubulin delta chain [Phytophthora citrophthora]